MSDRNKRLSPFDQIPPFARLDHRHFLNDDGELPFIKKMSRKERRKLKAESKKITSFYRTVILRLGRSGAGFPIDQMLRAMAIEYNHRFASSGTENMPVSFNYFEPFLEAKLIPRSVAPYMEPLPETSHLFGASDFFNYLTSEDSDGFALGELLSLPEAEVFHFSANGDVLELSFTDARSREYALSGFSMVRHGNSIHWCLVAGEILTDEEWELRGADTMEIDLEGILPWKRAFLEKVINEQGATTGPPVLLEGTKTAIKTVLSGEIDAATQRHLGKSIFVESENAFATFSDDPEIVARLSDESEKDKIIRSSMERIGEADALWGIAEGFLQLPAYFEARVTASKELMGAGRLPSGLKGKGGRGLKGKYEIVESVTVSEDANTPIIRKVKLPQYSTETEGHWRRLRNGEQGKDRNGDPVAGKTWVKRSSPWRDKSERSNVIYLKDSLAVAKAKVADLYAAALEETEDCESTASEGDGVLYVLRCALMQEEIYKIGWTSGTAAERAKQLSSATGVPEAFVVVKSWTHNDAEGLETEVHAMLAPYRLNTNREFFRLNFPAIERLIEQTIQRVETERQGSDEEVATRPS